MSLDLGELVGTLRMDVTPFDQALVHGEKALDNFAGTGKAAAAKAGNDISTEFAGTMAKLPLNAKGVVSETSAEFRALAPTVRAQVLEAKAAAAAGMAGMGAELSSEARSAGSSAASALGQGLSGAEAEAGAAGAEAAESFSDEFKTGAKAAGAAAGAGLGVAIGAGVLDNLSVEAGLNKVAVQLGLSQADMKTAGQVAGAVYANNFGQDLPQINEAVALVVKNIGTDVNSVDLQPITEQVLTVADAFDQDLAMSTSAVGQMIRTGLVKDAQEGLDLLTVGLQGPADKAGDLGETMNEYSTNFRTLGLDGADAMGLLSQAVKGGARDSDQAADALKEFSIIAVAGGEDVDVAFSKMGLNGKKMADDIAAGGPRARGALDKVLDGLRGIEDPADRARVATSLFGSMAEDMGGALYDMDLSSASKELGDVGGAAQDAVDQMGSGTQATIDGYSRKLIGMGRSAIEATGPTAAVAGAVAAFGPAVLGIAGPVASLLAARSAQAIAAGVAGTAETAATTATTTGWIKAAAASTAGALKMAASWLIAMGPIVLVIAAVAGVVFLVVKYWDEIKEYTAKAWDWVVDKVRAIPGQLVDFFMNFTLPGLIIKHWEDIKEGVEEKGGAMLDWVKAVPGKVLGFFASSGSLLKQKGKDLLQGLRDGAGEKWDSVVGWVQNTPERVVIAVGNVTNSLKGKGKDLLQGLRDGAGEKWDSIVGWVQGIPERFTNNVGAVGRALAEKGRELIQGLRDGAGERWDNIIGWIGGIGERVKNNVGNLGSLLKDAGIAIVQGLIDGVMEKFEDLKAKVASITKWVKDNKGPKEYDLMLWRGPGNWIMEGLMNGLDDQMPALKSKVGDVTDTIAGTPMPTLYASAAPTRVPESAEVASYAASQGGTGGGDTYQIYETTNPQATAAEVSRRQAFAGASA